MNAIHRAQGKCVKLVRMIVTMLLSSIGLSVSKAKAGQRPSQYLALCERLEKWFSDVVSPIPECPGQSQLMAELLGTDPLEALYLVKHLHESLPNGGDVCEFGVAQGATSALIANELRHHFPDRHLYLFDSFTGLPEPTAEDELINDTFSLGSMKEYEGTMSVPRTRVLSRLEALEWTNYTIVEGLFTQKSAFPVERVAFAYVDFDFYMPTKDALLSLEPRLSRGARIMVDDYGYFSSGAQKAVDEFVSERPSWGLQFSPRGAGPFCTIIPD